MEKDGRPSAAGSGDQVTKPIRTDVIQNQLPGTPDGYQRIEVPVDATSVRQAAAFVELWHRDKRLKQMVEVASGDVGGLLCGLFGLIDLLVPTLQETVGDPEVLLSLLDAYAEGIDDPEGWQCMAVGMLANRVGLASQGRWPDTRDARVGMIRLVPSVLAPIECHLACILEEIIVATAVVNGNDQESFFGQVMRDLRCGERFESSLAVIHGNAFYRKQLRVSSDPDLDAASWSAPCSRPECPRRAVDAHELCRNHLAAGLREEGETIPRHNEGLWAAIIHLTQVALAGMPDEAFRSSGNTSSILAFVLLRRHVDRSLASTLVGAFAAHLADLFGATRGGFPTDFPDGTMVSCRVSVPAEAADRLAIGIAEAMVAVFVEVVGVEAILKYGARPIKKAAS